MNKQKQIVDAAKELFSQYGYKKVTMDEIANKSGVTKKTIYGYFKNKNDLIRYFLNIELAKMKQKADEIELQPTPFPEKIQQIVILFIESRKNSKLLQAFWRESNESKFGIANECMDILDKSILEEIRVRIERAIVREEIIPCNPEITSFIIYRIYIAIMFEWSGPLDQGRAIASLMQILENGIFPHSNNQTKTSIRVTENEISLNPSRTYEEREEIPSIPSTIKQHNI